MRFNQNGVCGFVRQPCFYCLRCCRSSAASSRGAGAAAFYQSQPSRHGLWKVRVGAKLAQLVSNHLFGHVDRNKLFCRCARRWCGPMKSGTIGRAAANPGSSPTFLFIGACSSPFDLVRADCPVHETDPFFSEALPSFSYFPRRGRAKRPHWGMARIFF